MGGGVGGRGGRQKSRPKMCGSPQTPHTLPSILGQSIPTTHEESGGERRKRKRKKLERHITNWKRKRRKTKAELNG